MPERSSIILQSEGDSLLIVDVLNSRAPESFDPSAEGLWGLNLAL